MDRLILGPFSWIEVSSSSKISSAKVTLYATGFDTSSTTHKVDLTLNWGGRGSYNLIKTVLPSN